MSFTVLLAALAGVLLALAVADGSLLVARAWEQRARTRRGRVDVTHEGQSRARPWRSRRSQASASPIVSVGAADRFLATRGIRAPSGLRGRLAAAGSSQAGAAEQMMALKCSLAAAAGLAVLPGALNGSAASALLLLSGAPAVAFLSPDALVARRSRRRARLLRAQAPELLDRVRLGADAGLNPERALQVAAARGDGLLACELRAALAATRLGLTREEALARLCSRCPVPEVHALAAALRRSAVHGAPLAGAVASLAETSRAERARRIHDRSQRAAPKIQLVVALLLVPAALLLVAAGMLAGLR